MSDLEILLSRKYINRFELNFRLVSASDADFILELRTDTTNQKFISTTSLDVTSQIEWINNYKNRESQGNEFYFLAENELGNKLGVVRLYNFCGKTFNSGSWLVRKGADELVAFKIDLFAAEFGFEILGFEECLIEVRKSNKKILRYHKMFFDEISQSDLSVFLQMDIIKFQKKKQFLNKIINNIS